MKDFIKGLFIGLFFAYFSLLSIVWLCNEDTARNPFTIGVFK